MTLSKWQIFIVGSLLILAVFFIPRLLWLKKSVRTNAVVLYIGKSRFSAGAQTFPVFQFHDKNFRITKSGSYNLPYKAGDSVSIVYNPDNAFDLKIDDFKGHWIDRIMWLVPVLFVWILIFVPRDFNFSISIRKGKLLINFG